MANVATARRLRLLRPLRLRTLLVLISMLCLACGWEADRLHQRARAVALLNYWRQWARKSGRVEDLSWSLLPVSARGWAYPSCDRYSGVDAFPGVGGDVPSADGMQPLDVPTSRPPPEPTRAEQKQLVAAIATLPELQFVQVSLELDDDDLRTLSSLKDLEFLSFKTRRLTPAGVAQLEKLPKLWRLMVDAASRESLPAEAIAVLGRHPALELLIINGPLRPDDVARVKAALPRVDVEVQVPSN